MKPLKILYVCAELSPYATMGGLGDVANALPRALKAQGHDVRFALPCYKRLPARMIGDLYGTVVADLGEKTAYGALRISTIPGTQIESGALGVETITFCFSRYSRLMAS